MGVDSRIQKNIMKRLLSIAAFILIVASCGGNKDHSLICVKSGAWGVVNKKGEFVIQPQFRMAQPFSDGLALVKTEDGKIGYIDRKGEFVFGPEILAAATVFSEGLATVVRKMEEPVVINTSGKEVFRMREAYEMDLFHEGLCAFGINTEEGRLYGFVNRQGKVVIQPIYKEVRDFSNGMAAVSTSEGWGFINPKGKMVIAPTFSSADSFHEGLAAINIKGKWGYINPSGKIVIAPQFDSGGRFSEGMARVEFDENYGFIDKNGTLIINPQYDAAGYFSEGLAFVTSGHGYGYIDKKGTPVIPFQFSSVTLFEDGIANVGISRDKNGIIDKKGRYIINPTYDNIAFLTDSDYECVYTDYVDMSWLVTGGTWSDNPWGYDSEADYVFFEDKTVKVGSFSFAKNDVEWKEGRYSFKDSKTILLHFDKEDDREIQMYINDQVLRIGDDLYYASNGTVYNEKMQKNFSPYGLFYGNDNTNIMCEAKSRRYDNRATSITFYEYPKGIRLDDDYTLPEVTPLRSVSFTVKNGNQLVDSSGKEIAVIVGNWPWTGFKVVGSSHWFAIEYNDQ